MNYIVLGRFQPLHNGHALLIEKALDLSEEGDVVTVAIGPRHVQWSHAIRGLEKKEKK